ncbi:hypothetical protein [Alteromonas flava]|uniref:hypothetical protein n=1 Tax=Alteromonas flava TaxID=2048003 RepID=UPI000C28509C|nr:hypothetical protein [Alteromonas flava]
MTIREKFTLYYLTAMFSVVFAIVGFTYNTWRLEVTEDNNTIREAAFEVLVLLSELEQNIYALHYDNNAEEGSPRIGWVKVGLIHELSALISPEVESQTSELKQHWNEHWDKIQQHNTSVELILARADAVRAEIKHQLQTLP